MKIVCNYPECRCPFDMGPDHMCLIGLPRSNRFSCYGEIMKRHDLKILQKYYEQQVSGIKNFEIRKLDRDFKVGDEIKLNEIAPSGMLGEYKPTGMSCIVRITSITSQIEGLENGYGILGTEMVYAP